MNKEPDVTIKKNVGRFNEDVLNTGSYSYTSERLSAQFANSRMSECIAQSYDFTDRKVLDLGCGDGTYTLEFQSLGARAVLGVDPAEQAIKSANAKALKKGVDNVVKFETGNIYELGSYLSDGQFDCIVLRGVLHHLPDPARAVIGLSAFRGTIVVMEPNGNNPVLKLLEKFSCYHIEHEEQSFSPRLIRSWLNDSGYQVYSSKAFNIVPFFCPDFMAKILRVVGPFIERLPLFRDIACGQIIIVAGK